VKCYNSCNSMNRNKVETSMNAYFLVCDKDLCQRHKEQYYSMTSKCMAWINGIALDRLEVVKPVIRVSKFGPAGTRCPPFIGYRIDYARRGGGSRI